MFSFSREKRFTSVVSFREFTQTVSTLAALVRSSRPKVSVEILTIEDARTHLYAQVTLIMTEKVTGALKVPGCLSYELDTFTEDVWNRSFSVKLRLKDDSDPESFMIDLLLDKDEPRCMNFYGQAVEPKLTNDIYGVFAHSNFLYKVGDGNETPSAFNLACGLRKTGVRLK